MIHQGISSKKVTAWLLPITSDITVAVGEFELVHVLPEIPTLFSIPWTPSYCHQVLVWQERIIPLMDLGIRWKMPEKKVETIGLDSSKIGLFIYRVIANNSLDYGALKLSAIPQRCEVYDEWGCSLPAEWRDYARDLHSCFKEKSSSISIPILQLNEIFSVPGYDIQTEYFDTVFPF